MGTRADFYVGRGENAEWLGSIAWDGYPEGLELTLAQTECFAPGCFANKREDWPEGKHLLDAETELEYRYRIERFFENRDDVTRPEMGWPWPWENSNTTDYAYAFDGKRVWASCFGSPWFDPMIDDYEARGNDPMPVFPDMSNIQNTAWGGNRSGLIVVTMA